MSEETGTVFCNRCGKEIDFMHCGKIKYGGAVLSFCNETKTPCYGNALNVLKKYIGAPETECGKNAKEETSE